MNIIINTKKLNEALRFSATIANNNTNPTLTCVLIEVKSNKIIFKSSSPSVSGLIEIEDGFEALKEGKVLVPAKVLLGITSKIKDQSLELQLIDNNVLLVDAEKIKTQINVMDFNNFPNIVFDLDGFLKVALNVQIINDIQNKILTHIHTPGVNERVSAISGIYIDAKSENGKLIAIGTDKVKAALLRSNYNGDQFDFIIPIGFMKNIGDVLRLIDDKPNKEIEFFFLNRTLVFKVNNAQIHARMIDDSYPNLKGLFDYSTYPNIIKVKKNLLNDAIERGLSIVSSESNPKIQIKSNGNELETRFSRHEVGDLNEFIEIENLTNTSFDVKVNPQFLASVLKNSDSNEILIYIPDNEEQNIKKALIFMNENDPNFIQVLSRMRN